MSSPNEAVWLNTTDICSFDHVLEVSGLHPDELQHLVDTGILAPSNNDPDRYFFHTQCIVVARRARRLRDDFDLDPPALALALNLLRRMDDMQAELSELRARLNDKRR